MAFGSNEVNIVNTAIEEIIYFQREEWSDDENYK